MDEEKPKWKTKSIVLENTTPSILSYLSNSSRYNNDKQFVFAVNFWYYPDKYQKDEKTPKGCGIIWIKEKI